MMTAKKPVVDHTRSEALKIYFKVTFKNCLIRWQYLQSLF